MPILVQVAIGVIALAVILVAVFLVPTLRQISATARETQALIKTLETEIHPALIDLRQALRHLNKISEEVSESVSKVGGTVEAIREAGGTIRLANEFVQTALLRRLVTTTAFMKALKVSAKVLWKALVKRR